MNPLPRLLGIGTATPPLRLRQEEVAATLGDLWKLSGAALERWRRIVAGTAIDTRYGVMPIDRVVHLSTQARMEAYERHAPRLAAAAAGEALRRSGVDPTEVTDLVVVSCTGFSAPGLDVALVEDLGLPLSVRRTVVGFMGCFGAIVGLRTAAGACSINPGAVTLVVCLELCSLHVRPNAGTQNQVASAIFSDGAAAAVVAGSDGDGEPGGGVCLGGVAVGESRLFPQGRGWMTWRITDAGFAMTLKRSVPDALRDAVAGFVRACGPRPECFAVHPGGAAILDAVDQGLGLGGGCGLEVAREVLRTCGNMSSATVLFVLSEALRRGYRPPAMLLAFGPGLSVESLLLQPAACECFR